MTTKNRSSLFAITLGVAALLLSPASASADDMSSDWSGIYLGATAGGAFGDMNHVHQNGPGNPATYEQLNFDASGFAAGIQGGYIHQFDQVTFGVEMGYTYGFVEDGLDIPATVGPYPPNPTWDRRREMGVNHIIDGTVKLGFVSGANHIYVKGGYAGASVRTFGANVSASPNIYGDVTKFEHGWTVGGGFERKLTENVTAGIDFQHIDIGGGERVIPCVNSGCDVGFSDIDVRLNKIGFRLNYRFPMNP